ncbi:MAG: 2-phosphosulfolactate phosphatase [Pirellulales bacterium]
MTQQINVSLLPRLTTAEALADSTAVVIDVLRATTTICHALAAGAESVVPCLTVEEALQQSELREGSLLGGEREGVRIEGFDLGNSPAEYTADIVKGWPVVFTTTNGTKAMQQCQQAGKVLIAAFVNLSAVCRELASASRVEIVCAGTNNEITREDVLLAGAIVDELIVDSADKSQFQLNDQAEIAADSWRNAKENLTSVPLAERLKTSRGGQNVLKIGLESDIEIAATLDQFDFAPVLDTQKWEIRLP